jgi:hypothetical protein
LEVCKVQLRHIPPLRPIVTKINCTTPQGYGNIRENYSYKSILICWFRIWTRIFFLILQYFVMDSERKQRVSSTLNFFLNVLIIFVNSNVTTWYFISE